MGPESPAGNSAGALLRAARERQGLHIGALAAAMKVTQRKLEALESDRHEELDGLIFTRALAQSVCRALRIDAKPILALLPRPETMALADVTGSLNAPFRDRASRDDRPLVNVAQRLLIAAAAVFLLAAIVLFVFPWTPWRGASTDVAASASVGSSQTGVPVLPPASSPGVDLSPVTAQASPVSSTEALAAGSGPALPTTPPTEPQASSVPAGRSVPTSASTALPTVASPDPATSATRVAQLGEGALQIECRAASWVEVRERGGRVLVSRLLGAGEALNLDGVFPLTLTIGNATATRVTVRGKPVDLSSSSRDNVARLVLP